MKTLYALIILVLLSINTQAQDVEFEWVSQFSGESQCVSKSIADDDDGNVYTTGYFEDTVDFDPGAGIFELVSQGSQDAFVSKLDTDGNLIWVKQFTGTTSVRGHFIAVDDLGNVYSSGFAQIQADMDPGLDTFYLTLFNLPDTYISKLDNDGNFVWAKALRGASYITGLSFALDDSANVYVGGSFKETGDFNPSDADVYALTASANYDAFVVKLSSLGNFVWAKRFGGAAHESVQSIAVDNDANVYTTGSFSGEVDFDPSDNELLLSGDAFVTKYDSDGGFEWAKAIDGFDVTGFAIALNDMANVCYAGTFSGTVDFDPGTEIYELSSMGGSDIFISKLDDNGDFLWAGQMGGPSDDKANSIALDESGNVYTTGTFRSTADFDPGDDEYLLATGAISDIFVSKLDSNGNFNWAKKLGGPANEEGYSIAVDNDGNVYSTGMFTETTDFDPGTEVFTLISLGSADAYVHKMNALGTGVGIIESASLSEIVLYPNPNFGSFKVVGKNLERLRIFSIEGRLIQSVDLGGSDNYLVEMKDVSKGMYIVKVTMGNGEKVFRVVVE